MTDWRDGFRKTILRSLALVVLALACAATVRADGDHDARLLLTQRDAVQAFDVATGNGFQIGTASGLIKGTSFVQFQFTVTGPPNGDTLPIAFQNKVIITDLDGDQLFFDNNGTGSFHFGFPGSPFAGTGGPLTGTYVVTGGSGKFSSWKVGSSYDYRAIATNPPSPGVFGNVYAQVFFHEHDSK